MQKQRIIQWIKAAIFLYFIYVAVMWYLIYAPPLYYNALLKHSIAQLRPESVIHLDDVIPFDWDRIYTFPPYTSREEILQTIGIDRMAIRVKENWINEGMTHLIVIYDDMVIAMVLGYPNQVGYNIDFEGTLLPCSAARFRVIQKDGYLLLKQLSD